MTKKSAPGTDLLICNPDTNQIRVINSIGLVIWKNCKGKSFLAD